MKVIALDIDGVLCNNHAPIVKRYNEDWDDHLKVSDIRSWDVRPFVKPAARETFQLYWSYPDIYDEARVIPGALGAVWAMRKKGFRVIFVTCTAPGTEGRKLQWLKDNGFDPQPGEYHETCNKGDTKSLLGVDYLIDDSIENIKSFGLGGILFAQPWNFEEDLTGLAWISSWDTFDPEMFGGLSPNAPVTVNAKGGKQSAVPYRFDLFDPKAMFDIAEILASGAAKYGENNWRAISIEDNLNHALMHIYAYLSGDTQDNHLGHAACRLMFALALELE